LLAAREDRGQPQRRGCGDGCGEGDQDVLATGSSELPHARLLPGARTISVEGSRRGRAAATVGGGGRAPSVGESCRRGAPPGLRTAPGPTPRLRLPLRRSQVCADGGCRRLGVLVKSACVPATEHPLRGHVSTLPIEEGRTRTISSVVRSGARSWLTKTPALVAWDALAAIL